MENILHKVIPLWKEIKPFAREEDALLHEHLKEASPDDNMRYTDVTEPTVTCFPPPGRGPTPPSSSAPAALTGPSPGAMRGSITVPS